MKNVKFASLIFISINILMLYGCSATGPKFQQFDEPNKESALVYFYRPSKFLGGGTTINIMEKVEPGKENDKSNFNGISTVGKLRNNSYFKVEISPSEHKFTTNWIFDPIIISMNPNEIYCIKTEPTFSSHFFSSHPPLKLITKEICNEEIKNTKQMTEKDLGNFFY